MIGASVFPPVILSQHIAVLGKTGSGKTSTAKLIVEQVAPDARVCILDPIKSDWWGLTLDSDGRRPGLPFHILGGPFGHVPLHAAAGDAIGKIVATGSLRHSIIDMADFDAADYTGFFIAFARALFRHVTGVVYLVVEEAHVFAPKERAGFGEEAKSTHWMKKIATGARSKGLRLVVCTQRTQELHNAVLGSCDTIIGHRLTLPADQQPVQKWLVGQTGKKTGEEITESLPGLKTGEGWLCSGEAKLVERRRFPHIRTYDNSATPTGDVKADVRPAPVDVDSLRAIVGDAVQEAEANDPKLLRQKITLLEKKLSLLEEARQVDPGEIIPDPSQSRESIDAEIRQACDIAVMRALEERNREITETVASIRESIVTQVAPLTGNAISAENCERLSNALQEARVIIGCAYSVINTVNFGLDQQLARLTSRDGENQRVPFSRDPVGERVAPTSGTALVIDSHDAESHAPGVIREPGRVGPVNRAPVDPHRDSSLSRMQRKFLTALALRGKMSKQSLLLHAGYASSGDTSKCFAALVEQALMRSDSGEVEITSAGRTALGPIEKLPSGHALRQQTLESLGTVESKLLSAFFKSYPSMISKGRALELAGYASSGDTSKAFARLAGRGFMVKVKPNLFRASEEFFK
jgi:uncharacterized protein DUF87